VFQYPVAFGTASPDPEKLKKLHEALGYLESYLTQQYICGDNITVADHCLVASVSSFEQAGESSY